MRTWSPVNGQEPGAESTDPAEEPFFGALHIYSPLVCTNTSSHIRGFCSGSLCAAGEDTMTSDFCAASPRRDIVPVRYEKKKAVTAPFIKSQAESDDLTQQEQRFQSVKSKPHTVRLASVGY